MSKLFREAFNAGYSAGLAQQVKQEIKMSLISNNPEVKECANAIVDYLENDENGVVDVIKLVNIGILNSPADCFNELQDSYVNLNKPYNPNAFRLACKMLFDCFKVVADALKVP